MESKDWAALAVAKGCTLEDVAIVDEVDPGYNLAMGAPRDLVTVRVDLAESCPATTSPTGGISVMSVPAGPKCNSQTHGPGEICISKSGGRVYASWNYRGSGAVTGFIQIYQIPTNAIGCPTGTNWHKSGNLAWNANLDLSSGGVGEFVGVGSGFWW